MALGIMNTELRIITFISNSRRYIPIAQVYQDFYMGKCPCTHSHKVTAFSLVGLPSPEGVVSYNIQNTFVLRLQNNIIMFNVAVYRDRASGVQLRLKAALLNIQTFFYCVYF